MANYFSKIAGRMDSNEYIHPTEGDKNIFSETSLPANDPFENEMESVFPKQEKNENQLFLKKEFSPTEKQDFKTTEIKKAAAPLRTYVTRHVERLIEPQPAERKIIHQYRTINEKVGNDKKSETIKPPQINDLENQRTDIPKTTAINIPFANKGEAIRQKESHPVSLLNKEILPVKETLLQIREPLNISANQIVRLNPSIGKNEQALAMKKSVNANKLVIGKISINIISTPKKEPVQVTKQKSSRPAPGNSNQQPSKFIFGLAQL